MSNESSPVMYHYVITGQVVMLSNAFGMNVSEILTISGTMPWSGDRNGAYLNRKELLRKEMGVHEGAVVVTLFWLFEPNVL